MTVLKKQSGFRARANAFVFALLAAVLGMMLSQPAAHAQMVTGNDMTNFAQAFGLGKAQTGAKRIETKLVRGSAPGNILWPGEKATFTFALTNKTDKPLDIAAAKVQVIRYGTQGIPGDIWTPTVVKLQECGASSVAIRAGVGAATEFTVTPNILETKGGYALILDLGAENGGRQFLMSCVRAFKPNSKPIQYPSLSLDNLGPTVLSRLGCRAIRHGLSYKPTTDPGFEKWYQREGDKIREMHKNGITVLVMFGGGDFYHPNQPLGRPRPWLNDKGEMLDTKFDLAWTPDYDADFQKFVRRVAKDFGWPRGPVTAVSLWNEPWEGISISGWGADMLRYRDMYTAMADGINEARRIDKVDILVGGADSSSNALDKFFGDEESAKTFLPRFDFLSVHYQGMTSFATYKPWRNRQGPRGRVRIWDTESWVANTDDRVAAVIAANKASGYDRAMGVFGGNIHDHDEHGYGGDNPNAWSMAASVSAAIHFIGERPFEKLIFSNGLPWVMQFAGQNKNVEDSTIVVVGDLGEEFGHDYLPFRTARGLAEIRKKEAMRQRLAALETTDAGKTGATAQKLRKELATDETRGGATLTIANAGNRIRLYDFYGNAIPAAQGGAIIVPLDGRGFFLRGDGKAGAFAQVAKAVRAARVAGIEPVATVVHDLTEPLATKPTLKLSITNVLNRPIAGKLTVTVPGWNIVTLKKPLDMRANQTQTIALPVGGKENPANAYPLTLRFDAGKDGVAVHSETIHVNVIAQRTPKIDGDLSDWTGALGQIITGTKGAPSVTEAAWFPFKKFDEPGAADPDKEGGKGIATGYTAYDANYFYFAAKIADNTPDGGTLRFANRDDDQFFYPKVSYAPVKNDTGFSARWSGFLLSPASGEYTIVTRSDDGIRLWLDDKMLIDNWDDHGPTDNEAIVTLRKGESRKLRIEYYQGGGGGQAKLSWERGKNGTRETIGSEFLRADDGTTPGLSAEYFLGRDLKQSFGKVVVKEVDFKYAQDQLPETGNKGDKPKLAELVWPDNLRRYSYRKDPILPSGNFPNFDNVQIAFNVLPESEKRFGATLPGLPVGFISVPDMDYEYALNAVHAKYGGGVEVWRLAHPQLPLKHHYPRQPKAKREGPVAGAKLVVTHKGGTRIVECAIPWSEIPAVKMRVDKGLPIKFSFRVNDDAGVGTMELARGRSVSRRAGSFHVDWVEHWANEVLFGIERPLPVGTAGKTAQNDEDK